MKSKSIVVATLSKSDEILDRVDCIIIEEFCYKIATVCLKLNLCWQVTAPYKLIYELRRIIWFLELIHLGVSEVALPIGFVLQ